MLKNVARLEHVIGSRIFHFLCDPDSPLNEVRDALAVFNEYVDKVEAAARGSQNPEPVQENPAPLEEQPKQE